MGDPKFPRRQYATPFHPWKADRIAEENALQKKYGLKNKTEVWRAKGHLRTFRGHARDLLARGRSGEAQAQKETKQLLAKLNRMGILSENATLDDVLGLSIETVLGRRLQTLVYLKGYTSSVTQARQFINHGHVAIGGARVNVPGYYVKRGEEELIALAAGHTVTDDAHPVRPKRVEGQGPNKLIDVVPRVVERRGGPGGRGRTPFPPRFPPRAGPAAAPAAPSTPAAPAPAPGAEKSEPRPRKSRKTEGGGAF